MVDKILIQNIKTVIFLNGQGKILPNLDSIVSQRPLFN